MPSDQCSVFWSLVLLLPRGPIRRYRECWGPEHDDCSLQGSPRSLHSWSSDRSSGKPIKHQISDFNHYLSFLTYSIFNIILKYLDMRTLELRKQVAVISKYCHVEPWQKKLLIWIRLPPVPITIIFGVFQCPPVPMRVADKNISSIGDVDSIWEVGDALAPGEPSIENPPLMIVRISFFSEGDILNSALTQFFLRRLLPLWKQQHCGPVISLKNIVKLRTEVQDCNIVRDITLKSQT